MVTKSNTINIILLIASGLSICFSAFYTIEYSCSLDLTHIQVVEKFNYLYDDMRKYDANLPFPHIYVHDLDYIPKFYLDYQN